MSEPNPIGRPSKYDPKYCDELIEYFDREPYKEVMRQVVTKSGDVIEVPTIEPNDFPTLAGFAIKIGVASSTLREWRDQFPDFSAAYKRCIDFQEHFLVTNGLHGRVNTAFGIFTAKNVLKWRDKTDEEIEAQTTINIAFDPNNMKKP